MMLPFDAVATHVVAVDVAVDASANDVVAVDADAVDAAANDADAIYDVSVDAVAIAVDAVVTEDDTLLLLLQNFKGYF